MWHIARLYGKIERRKKKHLKKKKTKQDTHSRYLVPFVKPCWYCDSARAKEDALHLALRIEGIFLLQNVSHTQRDEKMDELWGHRFISLECKQKRRKLIKYIFVKLECKYPHLQELECWSYLLSRHGILLYVIYMQFIILWLFFILYLCLLKQVTVSGF